MQSRKDIAVQEDPFKTVTVNDFCKIAHVGRSKAYDILNSGIVRSVLVEGSRLVLIQDWHNHIARLLEQQQSFMPGRSPNPRRELADPPTQAVPPLIRRGRPPKYRPNTVADPAALAAATVPGEVTA